MRTSRSPCRRADAAASVGFSGDDVDHHGRRIGQGVVDRGTAPRLLDEAAQGLVIGVALDLEVTPIWLYPLRTEPSDRPRIPAGRCRPRRSR